ncbi:hypothetical protein SO802_003523 [Lithocarpus litseifolius]|uniref:Uncharacterized protein n=1 Tax=Lithocarpus litseifolius TaxID=425828 RepID=A0AAW2E2A1_9ROSI
MKEEERRRIAAVDAFNVAEKKIHKLTTNINEVDKDKKSVEAALQGVERQAKSQRKQLRQAKDQLSTAKEQIASLKKMFEEPKKANNQAEQEGYDVVLKIAQNRIALQTPLDVGVAKTEKTLRAEVSEVCKTYCLQVWNEALNQVGVEASSALRRVEKVYYPPAICASSFLSSSGPQATTVSK